LTGGSRPANGRGAAGWWGRSAVHATRRGGDGRSGTARGASRSPGGGRRLAGRAIVLPAGRAAMGSLWKGGGRTSSDQAEKKYGGGEQLDGAQKRRRRIFGRPCGRAGKGALVAGRASRDEGGSLIAGSAAGLMVCAACFLAPYGVCRTALTGPSGVWSDGLGRNRFFFSGPGGSADTAKHGATIIGAGIAAVGRRPGRERTALEARDGVTKTFRSGGRPSAVCRMGGAPNGCPGGDLGAPPKPGL